MLWRLVEASLFRWSPRPLHGFRAFLLRLFGARIAVGTVVVFPSVRTTFPWKLTLDEHAMIGPGVIIYNLATVHVRRGANLSQNVHLCAGTHDYLRWDMPLVARPITIGENAWIAADAFIGPGVEIGELTVVGARSVVMKSLPAGKVCAGNPCRPIKDRPPPVRA